MKPHLIVIFLTIILFSNCSKPVKNTTSEKNTILIKNIQIIKQAFKGSTDLIEYEIPVKTGTKIRHGIQKRYNRLGSIYSSIPYVNNKREGIAFTYYSATTIHEPQVWKEQSYRNNELDGICRRYHRNGNLQAEYEYKNGNPAIGLKEFTESGKPIIFPAIILTKSQTADGYYLSVRLSNGQKNVDFFYGDLIEEKYLPVGLKGLQVINGLGEIVIYNKPKSATITAVYTTKYQNKCIVSKTITL